MQSRAYVTRVSGVRGGRCASLSAPVGVLVEINFHVQRNRCALSYISERATRAPAFWLSLLVYATLSASLFLCRLSLFLCRLCVSLCVSLHLSLRLSLHLSLCVSLRLELSRSAACLDRRVCYHLSLRLSLSPLSASASLAQSTEVDHDSSAASACVSTVAGIFVATTHALVSRCIHSARLGTRWYLHSAHQYTLSY